jgi:hypothetical protein
MESIATYYNGNHRVIVYEDGTKDIETGYYTGDVWHSTDDETLTYNFPERITLKLAQYNVENIKYLISTMTTGTECNIEGGNLFKFPDFLEILKLLHDQGIITNVTIDISTIKEHKDLIEDLIKTNLIFALGISIQYYPHVDKEDIKIVDSFGSNVVIHATAGHIDKHTLPILTGRKVFIHGFNPSPKVKAMLEKFEKQINKNILWLKKKVSALQSMCLSISFDKLAISQLNPERVLKLSEEQYDDLFNDNDAIDDKGNIIFSDMFINLQKNLISFTPQSEKFIPFEKDKSIIELYSKLK